MSDERKAILARLRTGVAADQDLNAAGLQWVGYTVRDGVAYAPDGARCMSIPDVVGSVDAAEKLVPADCLHSTGSVWDGAATVGRSTVTQYGPAPKRQWVASWHAGAATPALALCVASIMAGAGADHA